MVFANLFFLYVFLPLFALSYIKFNKNITLCIFSLIFYSFGEPVYVFLLIFSVLVNFNVGLKIDKCVRTKNKKKFLIMGLIFNILLIFIFKYLNFFTEILFSIRLINFKTNILLPIGISFYTFQSITYIVDVYRKDTKAQNSFYKLLLYISMFPQLIAGPIVRYKTINNEIDNREFSSEDFLNGIYRFIEGLGKKVIIANQLSIVSSQMLDGDLLIQTKFGAAFGILAFILQLYFDFSGYSDMAIGMGRCIGFHFEENFNYPFISKNITEFWRRWHISLGTFFRDYVYIPLGGNKKHQFFNILIVWILTGMWHGASMNFIVWGLYLATIIIIEKYIFKYIFQYIPDIIKHIYMIVFTTIGFSIFYFDDFNRLCSFFNIFISKNILYDVAFESVFINNIFLLTFSIILSTPIIKYLNNKLDDTNEKIFLFKRSILLVIHIMILVISTILLIGNTNNPFLYTRF